MSVILLKKHLKILKILSNANILSILQIIIKLTFSIFMSPKKIFYKFVTYMKMPKHSSAKYCQNIKKDYKTKLLKESKSF